MPEHPKLLLVVADGEHARFGRPGADFALHTESALDSASAHKQSSDLGSDHPGAAYHGGSSAHHAETPRHDPHDLEKLKFARLVADQLTAAVAGKATEGVVIAAPAHSSDAIRAHLPADVAAKIVGTVHKDLVKTPDHELQPHVREWFRPTHRPAG